MARRWPHAVDGVALIVGSMVPDLAYAFQRSRFEVWVHGWPGVALVGVPMTWVVSWLVVRVLAPVVPAYLPDLGRFHLRDLRGLAVHRFGFVRTSLSALVGALSHIALDSLTHGWGWFARNLEWYGEPINDELIFGRAWTPFRIMQYVGHVVLSAVALWWLWRAGSQRWLLERARQVPLRRTRRGALVLTAALILGIAAGVAWASIDWLDTATGLMRLTWTTLAAVSIAAWMLGHERA